MYFSLRLISKTPNGLHDQEHQTTALDIAHLAAKAMENPLFRDLVSTPVYALPATNKHPYNGWNFLTSTNLRLLLGETANYQSDLLLSILGIKTARQLRPDNAWSLLRSQRKVMN